MSCGHEEDLLRMIAMSPSVLMPEPSTNEKEEVPDLVKKSGV